MVKGRCLRASRSGQCLERQPLSSTTALCNQHLRFADPSVQWLKIFEMIQSWRFWIRAPKCTSLRIVVTFEVGHETRELGARAFEILAA